MTAYPELAALAAGAAADPRKARSAVNKIAKPLPAADMVLFYEEAARVFHAAGEGELATAFFTQARKTEKKHPALIDLDRLHKVFLEFTPTGVAAPTTLRDLVKLMIPALPPQQSHDRFNELLDSAFATRRVPYAHMFPDLRKLAKALKIKQRDADKDLAERLLRTGAIANASHAVWSAAKDDLAGLARADTTLCDALIAAEPAPGADDDPDLAESIRIMWLETLVSAQATRRLPADWFFAHVRACPAPLAFRLAAGAAKALPPRSAGVDPDTDPLRRWPEPEILKARPLRWLPPWWSNDAALAKLADQVATPHGRAQTIAELDRFVTDLGYYANVDYRRTLRRAWDDPTIRSLLRERVEAWTEAAGSGSLPDLDDAVAHLAPLAEYGYYDLEPKTPLPAPPAPAEVLAATLRGGIPAEYHYPHALPHTLQWKPRMVQNGDLLTGMMGAMFATVYTPDGPLPDVQAKGVDVSGDYALWYDRAEGFLLTESRHDGWRTYRVVGYVGRNALLTLDRETMGRRPDMPSEAEVTFPGADAPTRISLFRGRMSFTAPDGRVTARVEYPPPPPSRKYGDPVDRNPVCPPGWWPRTPPVDVYGSQALRQTTTEQAERLLGAALSGPEGVYGVLNEVMPDVIEELLRDGVVATTRTAVGYLRNTLRLTGALNLPQPSRGIATDPRLPVGGKIETVAALRRVADVLEAAADPSDAPSPVAKVKIPELARGMWVTFGTLGGMAIEAARPWTSEGTRASLLAILAAWGNTPFGDGSGRWRVHYLTSLKGDRMGEVGEVWRTPSGAALLLGYQGHPHKEGYVLEHAPDGDFKPLDLPGWQPRRDIDLQGWGGVDRVAAFAELLAGRGPAPFLSGMSHHLAERMGTRTVDAAEILFGYPYFAGTPQEDIDAYPPDVLGLFTAADGTRLKATVSYPHQDAVRERLMPDDPASLWEQGPDLDRAAARYRELTGS